MHEIGISQNLQYYYDHEHEMIKRVPENMAEIAGAKIFDSVTIVKTYSFYSDEKITVKPGDEIKAGNKIAEGSFVNNMFYLDFARLMLVGLFVFLCILVYKASLLRKKTGRED